MKNPPISLSPELGDGSGLDAFPGEAELAALRGWYAGLSSRKSVAHYGVLLFLVRFRTFGKPLSMRVPRARPLATRMIA